MCGIIGYAGAAGAGAVVLDGLRRLEYRGYDSAGLAVAGPGGLSVRRRAGKLCNLEKDVQEHPLSGSTGIGHTRWATHGPPTDANAHPQLSCDGKIAVVHNGIIENFAQLRGELEDAGHTFTSATDTEVAAHLVEQCYRGDLVEALRCVCAALTGAFSLVVLHADEPALVVGARRNAPLVVGRGRGENFLASDVVAFIAHTREAVEIGQDQLVAVSASEVKISHFDGTPAQGSSFHVDWDTSAAEKGGYPNFMAKEIAEQPAAVADTLRGRLAATGAILLDEVRLSDDDLRDVDKVFIVACGSAFYAGLVAKYAIEHWVRIPCEVEIASEFRYRDPVLNRSTLVMAISQSGETLDTLMAVKHAREQQARVLSICNTNGSTIPRESDAVLYTRAGPEVAVAATKTFLAQVSAAYLVGLLLAQVRGTLFGDEVAARVAALNAMPDRIGEVLDSLQPVRELARSLAGASTILFLGRHVGYPVALEGALKLKELAYMHAEAFPAGELKHGPIALVGEGLPVIAVAPSVRGRAEVHAKLLSNLQEVRARGARTIVVASDDDDAVVPYAAELIRVPTTPTLLAPLVTTVPLQVFAYELALARGLDVDQPRNLAKSVTVE
ncbi:MAG: glutamine--fructose-6-phosphate transaminase (isomerizing) [Mycobacteriales bacterium]